MIHPRKPVMFNITVCAPSHLDTLKEHITGAKCFQLSYVAVIKKTDILSKAQGYIEG